MQNSTYSLVGLMDLGTLDALKKFTVNQVPCPKEPTLKADAGQAVVNPAGQQAEPLPYSLSTNPL